jgi:N4-gp56 family major capsid protein
MGSTSENYTGQIYGSAQDGSAASIGANTQINPAYFYKKALIELVKERTFGQLADVRAMPKNMGKTIKQHHYLPLLDDRNINDQGINASGVSTDYAYTIFAFPADGNGNVLGDADYSRQHPMAFPGNGASQALAITAAKTAFNNWVRTLTVAGGLGASLAAPVDEDTDFTAFTTTGGSYSTGQSAFDSGWRVTDDPGQTTAGEATVQGTNTGAVVSDSGNLYGSSKDPGYITARLPTLTENGGRVNRVGFRRKTIEATIAKFGFFDEYNQEAVDFDTDSDMMMHITRETLRGANEITEDMLQIDLLNAAGVVRYAGDAVATTDLGASDAEDKLTYEDLMRLGIELDNNRCPKNIKMITGTRMIDTKTVDAARILYIGSELIPTFKAMKDLHNNPAFIDVRHYAAGGNTITGEIGSVDQFRIVVVQEMMKWEGAGAAVGTNPGMYETGGNYDVFPALCVGSGSFTTIGFQTNGKTVKFKIKHAKPGSTESYANDPYGETGFYSIKWYYGFMVLRPEWIGLIKTLADY